VPSSAENKPGKTRANTFVLLFIYYAQVQHNVKHTIHILKILKYTVTKSIPNRLPNALSWTQWIFDGILWTKINVFIIHNRMHTSDVQIWTSYVKAFESYRLTDRQTDRHDRNYILYAASRVVKNTLKICMRILSCIQSSITHVHHNVTVQTSIRDS